MDEYHNLMANKKGEVEFRIVDRNNKEHWIAQLCQPVYNNEGQFLGRCSSNRDITERKQADEALHASKAQLSNALEMAHLGPWEYDVANDLFTFNDHFYKIFSTTVEQCGGYTMDSAEYAHRFVHPDDIVVVGEEIRKAIETMDPYFNRQIEHRMLYADGTIGYINVRFFIIKDSHGKTVKTYGVNQDITSLKKSEEALRENEEKFRTIFDRASDGILIADAITKQFLQGNTSACSMLGYTKEEIESLTVYDIHPPEDITHVLDEFEKQLKGEKILAKDLPVLRKDGSIFYVDIGSTLITIGGMHYLMGIFHDITAHKEAEEMLLKERKKFITLSENAAFGMVLIDGEGKITYVNPKFKELFGYDIEDVPDGRTWFKKAYPDPEYRKTVISAWVEDLKQARIGQKRPRTFKVYCKDGKEKIVNFVPVQLETGEHMMSCNDITEQKCFEEKLQAISLTDDLTGLYNRRGFFTLTQQQMKVAERAKKDMLLFFADLDKMKHINDTLGHQGGDKALIEVANILKEVFRESDIIGRMGGDEFAILAIDTTDETREVLIKRLHNTLDDYNRPEGRNYKLSLSIGIAHYDPEKPSSLDELIAQADTLMYEEKNNKQH
jgi:diguanylate cyclase (GGDEF)-like protein/PAS domain S-box-containing protein